MVQHCTTKRPYSCVSVRSFCVITKSKGMDKSRKMEGYYHGQRRTTWFPWNEGVTSSVICSLWRNREYLDAALCLGSPKAGSFLRPLSGTPGQGNLYRLSSSPHIFDTDCVHLNGIATSLKNGKLWFLKGHEGPEAKQRFNYTLSLTLALHGVGGHRHAPTALPPGKTR